MCKQASNNPSRSLPAACLPIWAYLRAPRTGSSMFVDGTAEGSMIFNMSLAFTWVASVVRPFTKRVLFAQNLAMSPLSSREAPSEVQGSLVSGILRSYVTCFCCDLAMYHSHNTKIEAAKSLFCLQRSQRRSGRGCIRSSPAPSLSVPPLRSAHSFCF